MKALWHEEYVKEKMFCVDRWGVNIPYYYCQNCAKSKEDVLNIIDNDDAFGVVVVYDFPGHRKKTEVTNADS